MPITRSPTDQFLTSEPMAGHGARVLHPGDLDGVSTRVGVEPHPLQDVGAVQRRVFDRHQDLVGAGNRLVDVLDRQDLGPSV